MKSTCGFASWALEKCAGGQVISLTRPYILDPYHHVQHIQRHQEHQPCSTQVCPVVINDLTLTLTLTLSDIADDKGKDDAGPAADAGTAESS